MEGKQYEKTMAEEKTERNEKSPRLDVQTIVLILQSIQGIAIILLGLSLIMR